MLHLEEFGKAFVFERVRPGLRQYLMKAGIDEVPYKFFGGLFYATLLLTVIVFLAWVYPAVATQSTVVVVLVTFAFWFTFQLLTVATIILGIYFYLNMKIYARTKKMEMLLPDYLQLVSTNLKGGMSFEKSLWSAIQPEFGILAKEITMVSKRVMTGNDVSEALLEFANKYDSPILKRSIDLIIGEIESGGKIAEVIDRVIINLRKVAVLKEEMAANTLTYIIFLTAIVVLIAPALFALSGQLLQIVIGFSAKISSVNLQASAFPVNFSTVEIDPADFQIFSVLALFIISVSSALIVSIIEKGDIKGGLKYVPLFVILSSALFFLFSAILKDLFGGLIL